MRTPLIVTLLASVWSGAWPGLRVAAAAAGEQKPRAAIVIGIVGRWILVKSGGPIRIGSELPDHALLRSQNAESKVMLDCGGKLKQYASKPDALDVTVSCSLKEPSASSWLSAASKFLVRDPQRYIIAASREDHELQEGVAPVTGEASDISIAFRGMPAGLYLVSLRAADSRKVVTERVHWMKRGPLNVKPLEPGLYELSARNAHTEEQSTSWILVESADGFSRVSELFHKAQTELDAANPDVDEPNRALLRAYLEALSKAR